jgi:hypothetical protein
MRTLVKLRLTAIIFGGFLASACAFGDRTAHLQYPPEQSADGPVVSSAKAMEAPQPGSKVIVVRRLDDLRHDKRIVGEVRNGWGMRTADVIVQNDVADWATGAVVVELKKAGFDVVTGDSRASEAKTPVLSGDVLRVYCTAFFTYEAEVTLMIRVKRGEKEIHTKSYTGKGSVGMNWAAVGESYAQSISLAMADALDSAIADIKQLNL